MNESDPRVKRTKKILAETLKQLLLEHDSYLDISIKELCEKAELNRRTFYLHYESIDDLLLDIQKEFALNYYDKTKKYDHLVDIEEIMLIFFQMTNDNSIYEQIVLSPTQDYLRESIKQETMNQLYIHNNLNKIANLNDAMKSIIESFYHITAVTSYREWYKSNKTIPMKEIANIAANLIRNGLESIVEKE